ncbi:MAG: hypothetical protein LBP94_00655, partial [Zoogloeaceae bacterium]|nr:hypothetical protein [Zoogloeaceae bacterium]
LVANRALKPSAAFAPPWAYAWSRNLRTFKSRCKNTTLILPKARKLRFFLARAVACEQNLNHFHYES